MNGEESPMTENDGDLDSDLDGDLDNEISMLLAEPSLWEQPSDDLEQRVVTAITTERQIVTPLTRPAKKRSAWPTWVAAAAIGAAAAGIVAFAVRPNNDPQVADARITINGTDLAPGISGTAALTSVVSGVRIDLAIPGLTRRDGDEFYQGWLKNCDSTKLVPIGTFHELDKATGWAGVALADYPILTITRETVAAPKDPAQGSSGEVVASGKLADCPGN
jgi:hypothetical protein